MGIDFGEQFPYDPEKEKAILKEAGSDQKDPLCYAITTHGAEAARPTIATLIKTHHAKLGGGGAEAVARQSSAIAREEARP